jgi:hypothetical protein
MSELVYHNGHYHRVRNNQSSSGRRGPRGTSVLRVTHDIWDEVLYGVGSIAYKIQGR